MHPVSLWKMLSRDSECEFIFSGTNLCGENSVKSIAKIMPFVCFVAAFMALSSNTHASSLPDFLSNGTYDGALGVNYVYQDNDGPDQGFANGFLSLSGESGELHGFKVGAGITLLADVWEKNDGDADDVQGELVNLAYLQYAKEGLSLTLGRQEIDLEWLGDYHEAVRFEYSGQEALSVTAVVTRALAVADPDEINGEFEELRNSDGDKDPGYALDVKYAGLDRLSLNGYFFGIIDLFKGYGIKADYEADQFGVLLHYAESNEDASSVDDGSVLHAELRGNIAGFGLAGGYITTDKDAGASSLASMGDNVNPFEDGNYVYDADADTWYAGAEYALDKLTLAGLCGRTEYGGNKERELNLIASYDLVEKINIEAILVDVSAEDGNDDYSRAQFMVTYAFN